MHPVTYEDVMIAARQLAVLCSRSGKSPVVYDRIAVKLRTALRQRYSNDPDICRRRIFAKQQRQRRAA